MSWGWYKALPEHWLYNTSHHICLERQCVKSKVCCRCLEFYTTIELLSTLDRVSEPEQWACWCWCRWASPRPGSWRRCHRWPRCPRWRCSRRTRGCRGSSARRCRAPRSAARSARTHSLTHMRLPTDRDGAVRMVLGYGASSTYFSVLEINLIRLNSKIIRYSVRH